MRVKKFEAKSMKEALQMVKKELGPDAVILAARDNRKSFGIGGSASVEITAAVSEATLQKKHFVESRLTTGDRARFQGSDARTQRQIIEKMIERRLQGDERERDRDRDRDRERTKRPITSVSYIDIQDEEAEAAPRRQAYDRAKGRIVTDLLEDFDQDFSDADQWQAKSTREVARAAFSAPKAKAQAAQPRTRDTVPSVGGGFEPGPPASQAPRPEPMPDSRPEARPAAKPEATAEPRHESREVEIATLKGEIDRLQKHMEQMMQGFQKVPQTFASMHPGADYGIPYDLSFMFQKLIEAGVTVDNTVEILQASVKELDPVQMKKRPMIDAWVARWFLNSIATVQSPWHGRLHLFTGGAGSGKTSTLVKMASHFVVKERKKVAILTTDSFKVGAVDQLKIYCQILNVPFAVLRSRKDWEWVLGQLNHVDHILVDFPGLQLRDLDEIHLMKSLMPPEGLTPISHYCVSATAKDGDAYELARRYRVTEYGDLIFTNLDQSVQHGIIYNLHRKTGKPLHSFGIGNRIPEDFEAATKERVLDLIFKLTKLKKGE